MSPKRKKNLLLMMAIAVIALNLRPAIAGVGPLIPEIRLSTGLSNTLLGMLITLPVLGFGMFSILTSLFTRKIGTSGTMALALVLLTIGILLRVIPAISSLYAGTIMLGVGIALGNVLLPGIVKRRFPHKVGLVTGIYSAMLGIGAALASGLSVPLSEHLNLGWRWSLGSWAALSILGLLIWLPQMITNKKEIPEKSLIAAISHLSSSNLAWYVALFMGLQSLTFYILITWLPDILIERGISSVQAGWLLSVVQAVGAIGTFVMPSWAARRQRQRFPVALILSCEIISLLGLMVSSLTLAQTVLLAAFLGFSLGSSFGMALLFIGLRARDSNTVNQLSGMSQSIGYSLAAFGPASFGAFHDVVHNWTIPLAALLMVSVVKLWSGWKAGIDEFV